MKTPTITTTAAVEIEITFHIDHADWNLENGDVDAAHADWVEAMKIARGVRLANENLIYGLASLHAAIIKASA